MLNLQYVDIEKVKKNPRNPRNISKKKLEYLKKSIKKNPKMLSVRPIVCDTNYMILGGNMRYEALKASGSKKIPVLIVEFSDEEKKHFVVQDNHAFGDWDYDLLAEDYDLDELEKYGLDIKKILDIEDDDTYTNKIQAGYYQPSGRMPEINELTDDRKYQKLVDEIENTDLPEEIKNFLKTGASRHIVFNFEKIADYYCNTEGEKVKKLMEKQCLILIDLEKAIENGYVELTKNILELREKND